MTQRARCSKCRKMQDVSNVLKARRLKCLTKTFERQLSVRKSPGMDEFLNVSQSARSLKKIQAIICQKSQFGKLFKTGEFGFKKEPDNHMSLRVGNQICLDPLNQQSCKTHFTIFT